MELPDSCELVPSIILLILRLLLHAGDELLLQLEQVVQVVARFERVPARLILWESIFRPCLSQATTASEHSVVTT